MRLSRPSLTLRRLATLSLAAVAALAATFGPLRPAAAQDIPENDKKELQGYKLTLEKLDKLEAVTKKLVAAAKADPQLKKEMQAIDGEKGGSISEINATFDKLAPHVVALLKAEGVDAHDYLLGLMSTMFASMSASAKAAGGAEQIPDFVPAANIELAEKNGPRFEQATKTLSELDEVGKAE